MTAEEVRKFARDVLEHASRAGSCCVYWNPRHARLCKTVECTFEESHMRYVMGVYDDDALLEWIEEDCWHFIENRVDYRTGKARA